MDRTVSLSTDASAESSDSRISTRHVNQPMNLGQQIGGQMVNPMFLADRAP